MRHRCFLSYHQSDAEITRDLVSRFGEVFIPTALGVTDGAEFVASPDEDYIKRRIRELHLAATTVTIVILGACTWTRRFIDWEIAASLRDDPLNRRSGLLALSVPGVPDARLPARFADNWTGSCPESSYAELCAFPDTPEELEEAIGRAFSARSRKADLVDNSRPLRRRNARCAGPTSST
jgi:MTH538 TIR-like domain (DUF1863)